MGKRIAAPEGEGSIEYQDVAVDGGKNVLPPARAFVLLRYTLIISTAYLLLVEGHFAVPRLGIVLLLCAALASNVMVGMLPARLARNAMLAGAITVLDTAWITTCLVLSDQFSADFFFLYFFILLLSAIGGSLRLVVLGAVIVCLGYVYGLSAIGGGLGLWSSPSLIRIPFLFTVAALTGYLVDRTRHEIARSGEFESANRTKSDFLAIVSHELRTPLTAIMGYTEMALDDELSEETRRDAILGIDRASHVLYDLVDNTLALRRMEEGRDAVHLERLSFSALWEEVRLACSPLALPGQVALQWRSEVEDQSVVTDPGKLMTIIRNLVSNALKFTEIGSVEVSAECDDARLQLRVADTGVGIPVEDHQRVFEMYRQADSAQRHRGTGLGLFIVQHFTEQLGGDVVLESEVGRGTVFTVTLPVLAPVSAAG